MRAAKRGMLRSAALGVMLALCVGSAAAQVVSGLRAPFSGPEYLPLTEARNLTGSSITSTAAAATDFVVAIVANTTMDILGHVAMSNTKSDVLVYEIIMPTWKSFGNTLTVSVYAESVLSAAPNSSRLLTAKLQSLLASPVIGTALSGGSGQTVNAGLTALTWTFDTSTITPGVSLLLTLTSTVLESDGGTAQMQIDSVLLN